jgi:hypothetical protein
MVGVDMMKLKCANIAVVTATRAHTLAAELFDKLSLHFSTPQINGFPRTFSTSVARWFAFVVLYCAVLFALFDHIG